MNFIQISLLIGLVIITVEKGYTYFKIRNNEDGKETFLLSRKKPVTHFYEVLPWLLFTPVSS